LVSTDPDSIYIYIYIYIYIFNACTIIQNVPIDK
jgi:hypothetical protein